MALTCSYPADAATVFTFPFTDASGAVFETSHMTAFQACKTHSAVFNTTPLGCGVDRATSIIVDFIVALALLYFVVTYILLALKLKGYRKQPYASVQVGLVYNTLQVLLAPASVYSQMQCHDACRANCCNSYCSLLERESITRIWHTPCLLQLRLYCVNNDLG